MVKLSAPSIPDQASKKPLFVKAAYSGATVAEVTPIWWKRTRRSLVVLSFTVNDKEWFIGSLLEQLDKIHGIQVLLPSNVRPIASRRWRPSLCTVQRSL